MIPLFIGTSNAQLRSGMKSYPIFSLPKDHELVATSRAILSQTGGHEYDMGNTIGFGFNRDKLSTFIQESRKDPVYHEWFKNFWVWTITPHMSVYPPNIRPARDEIDTVTSYLAYFAQGHRGCTMLTLINSLTGEKAQVGLKDQAIIFAKTDILLGQPALDEVKYWVHFGSGSTVLETLDANL